MNHFYNSYMKRKKKNVKKSWNKKKFKYLLRDKKK